MLRICRIANKFGIKKRILIPTRVNKTADKKEVKTVPIMFTIGSVMVAFGCGGGIGKKSR